jgi:flagellar basal-body rod protein FlgF/flagellar basal-body rod protein FlgG
LRLVRFERRGQLQKDGSSLFAAPPDVTPQPAQKARVVQGKIEQSNVRGVVEMARMVEVTRTYTQIASLIQQQGDLRRGAIDKLAEVPA